MSLLQVRTYADFTSSTLCRFYKFDLMSLLQVRPYVFFQARPYALFTSLTLCIFYMFDHMHFLQV